MSTHPSANPKAITDQAKAPTGEPAPLVPQRLGRLRAFAAGWHDFWFKPADPTVLGLIRICCGLMLVYVHVLSGLQLQELFGADAWLNVDTANLLRTQAPGTTPPDG